MNVVDFPESRRKTVLEATEALENDLAVTKAGVSRKTLDSTDVPSGPTQTNGMTEMCEKKYELTDEVKKLSNGKVLHRIRAVRDFVAIDGKDVHEGDLGGWIEKEDNLSHDGDSWVFGNAIVYGNAMVHVNAVVSGDAEVRGNAEVFGNANVFEGAVVHGDAKVFGNAEVLGEAIVRDDAEVFGRARIFGNAEVSGDAKVFGRANVYGNANVYGKAEVHGDAWVYGDARVCGSAEVFEDVEVCGNAEVCDDAKVSSWNDYATYKNTWSSGRWFTYTRSNKKWTVGCFRGTGEELIAKAYKDSERSGRCYEAIVRAQAAIDMENEESVREEKE